MRPGRKKNRKPEKRTGEFRIIAGDWRSRRIEFPDVEGLRPTTDRVRETLFNWLNTALPGAKVLDVFAGSGALGFEALSRGAEFTTFLELDTQAAKFLSKNVDLLKANAEVLNLNALEWVSVRQHTQTSRRYDLVFLDPPFRKDLLAEIIENLDKSDLLNKPAFVYIEQEKEALAPTVPMGWSLHRSKQAGQVSSFLYQINESLP